MRRSRPIRRLSSIPFETWFGAWLIGSVQNGVLIRIFSYLIGYKLDDIHIQTRSQLEVNQ